MQTLPLAGVKGMGHSGRRLFGWCRSTGFRGLAEIRRSLIYLNSVRGAGYQLLGLAALRRLQLSQLLAGFLLVNFHSFPSLMSSEQTKTADFVFFHEELFHYNQS